MKKATGLIRPIRGEKNNDSLPLLRGMFVAPETDFNTEINRSRQRVSAVHHDDGLILTPEQALFLGE